MHLFVSDEMMMMMMWSSKSSLFSSDDDDFDDVNKNGKNKMYPYDSYEHKKSSQ